MIRQFINDCGRQNNAPPETFMSSSLEPVIMLDIDFVGKGKKLHMELRLLIRRL